jgi:hypothetical protein
MLRRRITNGWEQDVHSSWRRLYCRYQHAGVAKRVKVGTNRRERHEGRQAIREDRYDAL